MGIKNNSRLWLAAFAVALGFDQLFWKKSPGISIILFIVLCLIAGFFLAWQEKRFPASRSLWLLAPILAFGGFTAFRLEPMTYLVNLLLALACMTLLVLTFRGGRWMDYSLSDDVVGFFKLTGSLLVRPFSTFESGQTSEANQAAAPKSKRPIWGIVRGLLLALPLVAFLSALLASADPIFSDRLGAFLNIFRIDNLAEYLLRLFYILIIGYALVGIYLHALSNSQEDRLLGEDKPWLPPFLGWLESIIVLGSVDLLFAIFVSIQFRYFFGGQANIHLDGFTFAEYARRGFSELVFVAFLSLLILFGLSTITRRDEGLERRVFSGLGIGLVGLVGVILFSAYQRLLLYEHAYGFSRIRTYTHVFMIWLGILLLITIVLELIRRPRVFGLAALLVSMGFGLSLDIINVDGWIVRQNINQALQGSELDSTYLSGLSADAIPTMGNLFMSLAPGNPIRDELGASLACWKAQNDILTQRQSWPSYHFSSAQAQAMFTRLTPDLSAYPVTIAQDGTYVKTAGQSLLCPTRSVPFD